MTIQEILEVHVVEVRRNVFTREEWPRCKCGWIGARVLAEGFDWEPAKRDHVAEVLEKHMQEREAAVIAGLAELMEECETAHGIAECAAYTGGEVGRQAVIENWERITDEPAEWLREQAKLHHERGFDYLKQIAYEAWQAGKESTPNEENPYADEDLTNGR